MDLEFLRSPIPNKFTGVFFLDLLKMARKKHKQDLRKETTIRRPKQSIQQIFKQNPDLATTQSSLISSVSLSNLPETSFQLDSRIKEESKGLKDISNTISSLVENATEEMIRQGQCVECNKIQVENATEEMIRQGQCVECNKI